MFATPSCFAMSGRLSGALLNFRVEERAMTLRSATFASRVRISSCTPSVKNALSGSRLRFSNGRTAMLLAGIGRDELLAVPFSCGEAGVLRGRSDPHQPTPIIYAKTRPTAAHKNLRDACVDAVSN